MARYETKTEQKVVYSYRELEVFEYQKPIVIKIKNEKNTKILLPTPEEMKALAEANRLKNINDSVRKARTRVRRLISSNNSFTKFLTLTFENNIQSLDIANYKFNLFIKRLRNRFPQVKYLVVPAFQPISGRVHYHLVLDLPFLEKKYIADLWRYGFIDIRKIARRYGISNYVTRYMLKDASDDRFYYKKKYFTSQNLLQPIIEFGSEVAWYWLNKLKSFLTNEYTSVFNSPYLGSVYYAHYDMITPIPL